MKPNVSNLLGFAQLNPTYPGYGICVP